MVITTKRLCLTNSKLGFCVGSNLARIVAEMCAGEDP